MTGRLGVIMDPIEDITVYKDSTLAMLVAAQSRGFEIWYMQQGDLYTTGPEPRARASKLTELSYDPQNWYQQGPETDIALSELDVILMRKDPPFDMEFIYTTYLLERAEMAGTLVVNKAASLRDCNEKMFATTFPQCSTPLLVSRDRDRLRGFHGEHNDVIYKPLDGMGGASIFRIKNDDPNISVILDHLTEEGGRTIMAQKYIPEISDGDKRILMINGEPVPYCLARIPAQGESRGNLAAGGRGEARPLTERDQWICSQIGPELVKRGLIFVGIDVIGDFLTEINVTSPTCIREIDTAYDTDIGGKLMDAIEKILASK
ncbi:MAG: glutathione synthase [Pseudomonadales bacterium]